jgi:hypothetical protein
VVAAAHGVEDGGESGDAIAWHGSRLTTSSDRQQKLLLLSLDPTADPGGSSADPIPPITHFARNAVDFFR